MARENLHLAATAYLEGVERALPGITSRRITDLSQSARDGAAAAAQVGDTALADRLWRYTEQVAAARTTAEDVAPPEDWFASADIDAIYPSARAYSLIRLGRLSGFNALRFVDPPPEVSESADTWGPDAWGPVEWGPADIDGLLVTAEICYRFGKPWRGYERPSEKGLIPVLQALVASLRSPESAADRATAQAALKKYLGMIRHPSDLRPIYLLVLDLQRAFPHVFIPVAPDPL